MNGEAPTPLVVGARCGRGVARKNPSRIPPFRAEFLAPLPSQILRPLYAAADTRRSPCERREDHAAAASALVLYAKDIGVWTADVEDSMQRHGAATVDRDNEAQCQAFLAGVGLTTLQKRYVRETAIEAAKLQLEILGQDLGLADGD